MTEEREERRAADARGPGFGWSSFRRRLAASGDSTAPKLDQAESPQEGSPARPPAPPLRPSGQFAARRRAWGTPDDASTAQPEGDGPAPVPLNRRTAGAVPPQGPRPTPRLETVGSGPPTRGNPQAEAAKVRLHELLIEELDQTILEDLPPEKQREVVIRAARELINQEGIQLGGVSREELLEQVADEVLGLGPLEPLLRDPSISEVMVNDVDKIYFEQDGRIFRSPARFRDKQHLMRIIERIVAPLGRRIDEASPMVDARLPDGSRVNITIPPISPKSPTITIRKFRADKMRMADLIAVGTLSEQTAEFLAMCVRAHLNIIISGGTGTGKTTLLNALSSYIPNTERIITIEDPAELRLQQEHVITLEARPPSIEGKNAVLQRDLVRNALRMRPDRIIVGEVRGPEAFDMLQAMNTGHDGSISTIHANSPRDAVARLENMVLMAGMDLPARAIREQIASAVDLIIQVQRLQDGSRKITHVTEVSGMEGETVTLQDIFLFKLDYVDEDGKVYGSMQPTGIRPGFAHKFALHGIELPPHLFGRPEGAF
ncbi:Putative conjugal transfer protein [bacterium HR29]|jgi:pilus assembly protein CpaF|nr:Putative conjugal transfer protein [bacterium HR29]